MRKMKSRIYIFIQRVNGYIMNSLTIKRKGIRFGKGCIIYGKSYFFGPNKRCVFGRNCVLKSGIRANPLGGANKLIFSVGENGKIIVGDNVGISNSCFRIESELVIENNVRVGGDCKFYDNDMHSIDYFERMQIPDKGISVSPIIIHEGAWVGAHCIVLKGVEIGKRSVVGAGSVVTKSIPPDEVWAGNPARFIRKIDQTRK